MPSIWSYAAVSIDDVSLFIHFVWMMQQKALHDAPIR